MMALHFFTVSVLSLQESEANLNQFIAQNTVVDIDKSFVENGSNSFWAVCVTTATLQTGLAKRTAGEKRKAIDYKEILSIDDFDVYSELRNLRKKVSDDEGVPAYAVFTNEQLSKMVTNKVRSKTDLLAIDGVGQSRIDKYSKKFLSELKVKQ